MSNYPTQQRRPAKPPVQQVDFAQYLAAIEPDFNAAVTEQRIKWAKEFEYAKQAIAKNKLLRETAETNLDSLRAAIINVAATGISLNPIKKQAFLVPRGNAVCLDVSYQGLIDLAVDAGSILWAEAKAVYSNDTVYKNRGVLEPPLHEYDPRNRGELELVYSLAKRHDGTYHVLEIGLEELEKIRAESMAKGKDGPWQKWFEQMCLKAVVKRASKWWARVGDRFHAAVQILNDQEGNADPIERDVTPTESETLNDLLAIDESPMVDGMAIEDWILAASTKEEFERARDMVRDMPQGREQNRLKKLWITMLSEAAHSGMEAGSDSDPAHH